MPEPHTDADRGVPAADPPAFGPALQPAGPWVRVSDLIERLRDRLTTDRRTTLAGLATALIVVTVVVVLVRSSRSAGARPEVSLPPASGSGNGLGIGSGNGSGKAPVGTAPVTSTPEEVVVYVAGAANHPGVYHLQSGARVTDALDAAGGPRGDADLDRMNLAASLSDGDRVYVPVQGDNAGDPLPGNDTGSARGAPAAPVNINSATADELDALPGVGPSVAAAIVEFRRQHGRFVSVDSLLDVPGIGPAKLAALRSKVRV